MDGFHEELIHIWISTASVTVGSVRLHIDLDFFTDGQLPKFTTARRDVAAASHASEVLAHQQLSDRSTRNTLSSEEYLISSFRHACYS